MPKNKDIIISQELASILSKAVDNKIYGSVEIYFEDGEITQITQRIIKKVNRKKSNIESNPLKKVFDKGQTKHTSEKFYQS